MLILCLFSTSVSVPTHIYNSCLLNKAAFNNMKNSESHIVKYENVVS